MSTPPKLKKQIQKRNDQTDADLTRFQQHLSDFLKKNLKKILRGIETGDQTQEDAARTLGGVLTSLRSAGLSEVLGQVSELYGREMTRIQDFYESHTGKAFQFTDSDRTVVQTLIGFEVDQIANNVDTYANELRKQIFQQVVAGAKPDISSLVDSTVERSTGQINTDLNTSMAGFTRSINLAKGAEQGFERYLYSGGLIETSREFCIERDGKVFTLEEIQEWDNGQGLPADVYLGGYNCRHDLLPVDDEILAGLGIEDEE